MPDCPRGEIRDRLPDLVHGRLDVAARAAVERHVATCEPCAAEVALLRGMQRALGRGPAIDTARIAAAVRAAMRAPAPRGSAFRTHLRAAAAVVALAAAGGVAYVVGVHPGTGASSEASGLDRDSALVASVESVPRARVPAAATTRPAVHNGARPRAGSTPSRAAGLEIVSGLADLSDGELQTLLNEVDALSATPDAEPTPVIDLGGEEM